MTRVEESLDPVTTKMEVEMVPLHRDPYEDDLPHLSRARKKFRRALLTASYLLIAFVFVLGMGGVLLLIVWLAVELGVPHHGVLGYVTVVVPFVAAMFLVDLARKVNRESRWTYHPAYLADGLGPVVLRTDWLTGHSQYYNGYSWSDDLSACTIPREHLAEIKDMRTLGETQPGSLHP